jgi:BMFP domain-containing protein YqiC
MDLTKVLAQLRAELENLNAAIASLERIQQGGRRRGRPPVWPAKTRPKSRNGAAEPDEPEGD